MGRGRWTLPLLVTGMAAWVDALFGQNLGSGLLGVAAAAITALLAGWRSRTAPLLICVGPTVLLLAIADQVAEPDQFSLVNDLVFYAVLVVGPASLGALLAARSRQVRLLRVRVQELARRRDAVLLAARVEEVEQVQRRVTRALAGRLQRIIDGVRDLTAGDPALANAGAGAVDRLADVEAAARSALGELRDVLGVLGAQPTKPQPQAEPASDVGARADGDRIAHRPLPTTGAVPAEWLDLLLFLACIPVAIESAFSGGDERLASTLGTTTCAAVQGLMLPVLRRRPIVGTSVLMLAATVQTAFFAPVPPLVTWLLPGLLAAYLVGAHPRRATAVAGLAVATGGDLVVTWATPASDRALSGLAPGLVMGGLVWWGGRTVAARERRRAGLAAVAADLAHAENAESRMAAAAQRAELTRELHDIGAHALTVVCLQAGAARRMWERDPAQARVAIDALGSVVREPLSGLDRSLSALAGEDGASAVTAVDLGVVTGLALTLGLDVDVVVRGDPRALPASTARAAFAVAREALTNAARHAPRSRVRLELHYDLTGVTLSVTDAGAGDGMPVVQVPGAGIGLRGLRERVEACAGQLSYGPAGTGFSVHAQLPAPPIGLSRAVPA